MRSMDAGTKVQFTCGPLGVLASPSSQWFEEQTVTEGDRGVIHGPHPQITGWFMVETEIDGETFYVPAAEGHIIEAETA